MSLFDYHSVMNYGKLHEVYDLLTLAAQETI